MSDATTKCDHDWTASTAPSGNALPSAQCLKCGLLVPAPASPAGGTTPVHLKDCSTTERALGVIRAYVEEERRAGTRFNDLNAEAVEAFLLAASPPTAPPAQDDTRDAALWREAKRLGFLNQQHGENGALASTWQTVEQIVRESLAAVAASRAEGTNDAPEPTRETHKSDCPIAFDAPCDCGAREPEEPNV